MIVLIAACTIALLPMSVSLASVDCLFHAADESDQGLDTAGMGAAQAHGGFQLSASDLSDIGVVHAEAMHADHHQGKSPNGHCSTNLILSLYTNEDVFIDVISNHGFESEATAYRFTNALLPTEIRPPISG